MGISGLADSYLASLAFYVPEVLACVTMLALILIESSYSKDDGKRDLLHITSYLGLTSVLIYLFMGTKGGPQLIFTKGLVVDSFSQTMKIIMTLGTGFAIYLGAQSSDIQKKVKGEFSILAVGVLIGGMLLASANNLLNLYIGIETLSILSYAMASLRKGDQRSSEAGLKYSLYGGVSAGIMLFGMGHMFGQLGTINFTEMAAVLKANPETLNMAILVPSALMFFVGIGYKIACVPFHMWTPDVYEGSPIPVTAFFSVVPKIAGVAAFVRISQEVFAGHPALSNAWIATLSLAAVLTMTVGNISAINQSSVKRMLAYSSISHAGVLLLGVLVIDRVGTRAILFYGMTYLFMTMLSFYVVSFVQDKYQSDHFDRFRGLINRYPMMAIALALSMFSLAGIPPLSGFVAKFHIFTALVQDNYYELAILFGLNSVVSLYYYLKIVRYMIFEKEEDSSSIAGLGLANQLLVFGLSLPVLFLGIFWSRVFEFLTKVTA